MKQTTITISKGDVINGGLGSDALALYLYLLAREDDGTPFWKLWAFDVGRRFDWGEKRRRNAYKELEAKDYIMTTPGGDPIIVKVGVI